MQIILEVQAGIIDYATKCEDEELYNMLLKKEFYMNLEKNNPNKKFYFPEGICLVLDMKKTTLT